MKTYKFKTKITKTGEIKIPLTSDLYDKDVDIFIVAKEKDEEQHGKAADFISKWKGILTTDNPDKLKSDYLFNKYK